MQVVRKEVEHLGECDVIEDGDEGDDNIYVLKDPNDGWMGCIVCLQYGQLLCYFRNPRSVSRRNLTTVVILFIYLFKGSLSILENPPQHPLTPPPP